MSWQWILLWTMVALFAVACLSVIFLGGKWNRVKVPRPQPPNKTDREIRNFDRFIKTLRDVEEPKR